MTHHIACRLNAVVLRTARLDFQRSQSTILVGDATAQCLCATAHFIYYR